MELSTVFFVQWMAIAAWMVPLTLILTAHGFEVIQPFAFATTALAAFVSPLMFGALADRQVAPTRVLRWLSFGSGVALVVVGMGIKNGWNPWLVLGLIQSFALCASPTVSISSTIAFSRIQEPRRQFGPIRAMGTIGWMVGCWIISWMGADESTLACFFGAGLWIALAGFTYVLPRVEPPRTAQRLTVRQRLGLDALTILRNSDHRVVFITATLFTIPLAAFYPITPPHLRDLGLEHASAWMSLGQTTEIIAMFSLGALLVRWRLKWILGIGLALGVLRFTLCALDEKVALLVGVALHGCTYTLFFTTAQIYVNERVDSTWRARAQALLTLMLAGVGHLLGYLSTGWWYRVNDGTQGTRWSLFWGVLAAVIACVLVYFLSVYRGRVAGTTLAGEPAQSTR